MSFPSLNPPPHIDRIYGNIPLWYSFSMNSSSHVIFLFFSTRFCQCCQCLSSIKWRENFAWSDLLLNIFSCAKWQLYTCTCYVHHFTNTSDSSLSLVCLWSEPTNHSAINWSDFGCSECVQINLQRIYFYGQPNHIKQIFVHFHSINRRFHDWTLNMWFTWCEQRIFANYFQWTKCLIDAMDSRNNHSLKYMEHK